MVLIENWGGAKGTGDVVVLGLSPSPHVVIRLFEEEWGSRGVREGRRFDEAFNQIRQARPDNDRANLINHLQEMTKELGLPGLYEGDYGVALEHQ